MHKIKYYAQNLPQKCNVPLWLGPHLIIINKPEQGCIDNQSDTSHLHKGVHLVRRVYGQWGQNIDFIYIFFRFKFQPIKTARIATSPIWYNHVYDLNGQSLHGNMMTHKNWVNLCQAVNINIPEFPGEQTLLQSIIPNATCCDGLKLWGDCIIHH